jgi:hypothetical protein
VPHLSKFMVNDVYDTHLVFLALPTQQSPSAPDCPAGQLGSGHKGSDWMLPRPLL